MPRFFKKTILCGCVVKTILVRTTQTELGLVHFIGGHEHIYICPMCRDLEEEEDTLHDMWLQDDMTNNDKYAGWEEMPNKNDIYMTPRDILKSLDTVAKLELMEYLIRRKI